MPKTRSNSRWTRWTQWEYWPFWVFNTPVIMIWIWHGIKAGSLFFFSRVNPGVASGGMMGESKYNMLRQISPEHYPNTSFIPGENANPAYVKKQMEDMGLEYPVILKPDVGERGKRVEMITNDRELALYLDKCSYDCLLQQYIAYPKEAAILYYRIPGQQMGHVTSVCVKENLHVTGDGKTTLLELMSQDPRSAFQMKRLLDGSRWKGVDIPAPGEKILLEPIGNHSRGTKFMDGGYLIDDRLTRRMAEIHGDQEAINYARYDLKYSDWDSFLEGRDFAILEVNGVSGEPAHMYDPKHSALYAYRTIYRHWGILLRISRIQKAKGIRAMSFNEALTTLRKFIKHQKVLAAR